MSLFGFLKKKNACQLLADPDDRTALKYRHFKELLEQNDAVLDALAALEQTYYGGEVFTSGAARQTVQSIGEATACMVSSLENLAPKRHAGLDEAQRRILAQALAAFDSSEEMEGVPFICGLGDVSPENAREAGGKAGNLARVRNALKLPTPDGFVVTTAGFRAFMRHNGLHEYARKELETISPLDLPELENRCGRIQQAILEADLPADLSDALGEALESLKHKMTAQTLLAVRSSAVGEDGAASFAGQYESVLNVPFERAGQAIKEVFASKYTPRAVLYRLRWGLDDGDAPMAVLVLTMVDSQVSGVLYTIDPSADGGLAMRLDAVSGLGDKLVSGESKAVTTRIARNPLGIVSSTETPLLSDNVALELGRMGMLLEEHFESPQDVEWCLDGQGKLVIVQSRPLDAPEEVSSQTPPSRDIDLSDYPTLLAGGVCASAGVASGTVLHVEGVIPETIPEGAILVAVNAAPELAALLDRAGGIVTAMGGAASHLASVAREMGIPAIFAAPGCKELLLEGQEVTLDASNLRVFKGRVEALLTISGRPRSRVVDSPMHVRLRTALDVISPLTLTDPDADTFSPAGCKTLHDVVRYTHEKAMREMFGMCENAEGANNVARLKAQIPLTLYCVDLGGGLRDFLTTCDDIKPEDLRSTPMCAIWRGFTHPGITWSGTVAFDAKSFMTLMASSATAEVGGGTPGGDSYALLGAEYMNLSARFGYHFANIDAFCGEVASQNHIKVRFAGGAGTFSGKCLRVTYLAKVLARLGFTVDTAGDVLDASLKGAPLKQTESALDQLGRLMAVSRLLDMAISGQSEIDAMTEAFFKGDYDLLAKRQENPLPEFHLAVGDWESALDETGAIIARQDGARWATGLSKGFTSFMGKLSGRKYQRFLDNVEAYFYFPLAVAKGSDMEDGRASLKVKPVAGAIDQAGGLAFAVRTAGTYLVLRINALEDNLILFAFKDGRRSELASAHLPVATGHWRELAVEVRGNTVTGFVDGKPYIVHHFDYTPKGLVGVWSKADSVVEFMELRRSDEQSELVFLSQPPRETKMGDGMNKTITPAELRSRIESGENITLLDLRKQADFDADPVLIPGAVKLDPSKVAEWEDIVPGKANTVIYCARGGSISQSIQKHFEQKGISVPYIEGGFEAWKSIG